MKAALFILSIFLVTSSEGQGYISTTRAKAKTYLQEYTAKNNYQTNTNETDTTIEFALSDPKVQKMEIKLYFNKKERCIKDIRTYHCDSCFHKSFDALLLNKNYHWKKIGENTFASIGWRTLVLIKNEESLSYTIEQGKLKKGAYFDLMRMNKE